MKTQQDLIAYLASLGIQTTTHEHQPLFTCEQANTLAHTIPGAHCKNLFLKDDSQKLWLIVALQSTKIELKKVGAALGARNLRFAKPDLLLQHLGVTPGSVTPFALINDSQHSVTVVVDKALNVYDILNFHPLVNTATTAISLANFKTFLQAMGHGVHVMEFQDFSLSSL